MPSNRHSSSHGASSRSSAIRAVFVLHYHAGLSLADIADIVGVPVGTVKSRLHHAIRSLRAALVADSQVETTEARPA